MEEDEEVKEGEGRRCRDTEQSTRERMQTYGETVCFSDELEVEGEDAGVEEDGSRSR